MKKELEKNEAITVSGDLTTVKIYKTVGNDKNQQASISNKFFSNIFFIENKWNYIKFLLNVKISSKPYNEKECYCINLDKCLDYIVENVGGFLIEKDGNVNDIKFGAYFEKDTGLMIYNPFQMLECTYKFNCLAEDDLKEPNILEYKVIQSEAQ